MFKQIHTATAEIEQHLVIVEIKHNHIKQVYDEILIQLDNALAIKEEAQKWKEVVEDTITSVCDQLQTM